MLKINEIFYSIQGESSLVGFPTVFVRTSGCHLRCTYCDTTYAYYEGRKMDHAAILAEIQKYQAKHICLTGGEPLLQPEVGDLMRQLCDLNYTVSLETSGDLSCKSVDPRVRKIIDIKTPDSGEFGKFSKENLQLEDKNIEFKFVICSEKDFLWAEEFSRENRLFENFNVLYSPSFNQIAPQWLAEKILLQKSPARLQLQLHKYIWSERQRGV
ncbi:MAG: radical SAM protein [Bdellovibrionales bacterium]